MFLVNEGASPTNQLKTVGNLLWDSHCQSFYPLPPQGKRAREKRGNIGIRGVAQHSCHLWVVELLQVQQGIAQIQDFARSRAWAGCRAGTARQRKAILIPTAAQSGSILVIRIDKKEYNHYGMLWLAVT